MVMDVMHGGGDARDTCRVTLLSQHAVTRAEARDPPTQTEIIDPHRKNMQHEYMHHLRRTAGGRVGNAEGRGEAVAMEDEGKSAINKTDNDHQVNYWQS